MTTKEVLQKALDWLGPYGARWTRGYGAHKGCALVALGRVAKSGDEYEAAKAALHRALPLRSGTPTIDIVRYNDANEWPEIQEWLERAIEAA
jgi:hypothetical protein